MDPVEYPMQAVAPTVAALLGVPTPAAAEADPIGPVMGALGDVDRVAVLAVDALGLRIWGHWRDRMPFLSEASGRRLAHLRSILPSVTPVNFGCMVTGASLDVHGARARDSDFTCETLFDVLRANGKRSAGLGMKGWTGNELLGRYADLSCGGLCETDGEVEGVLERVLDDLPDFVIVQFGATDKTFHAHGPYSAEAADAVGRADAWLARWAPACCDLGYGVIMLADHGQHPVEGEDGAPRGSHGTDSDDDCVVPLVWGSG